MQKLAGRVQDIEILFFDISAATGLPTREELQAMASVQRRFGLTFSLHTPLDVMLADTNPERRREGVETILQAVSLAEPIAPRLYVVHVNPPPTRDLPRWQAKVRTSLEALLKAGVRPRQLCIETLNYDFAQLEPVVAELRLSVAIDVGHLQRDGVAWEAVLQRNLPRTRIIHWHGVAPEGQDHRSLAHFPRAGAYRLLQILREEHYTGVLTLEVFRENDFEESWRLLQNLWISRRR